MKLRFLMASAGLVALLSATPTVEAELLTNPSFESPAVASDGGEINVSNAAFDTTLPGWSSYNNNFVLRQDSAGSTDPIGTPGAKDGVQALKNFGAAGVFADFDASEGDEFNGSVWALNPDNTDALVGGQIGLGALIWLNDGGGVIDSVATNVLTSQFATGEWNLLSVNGTAPALTAKVRFQIFTEDTGGGGGAPRFDDASLTLVPEPGSLALLSLGAVGIVARRRRRR